MKGGGYIFHSDHSVPPTVSFDNYKYAMELVDKYGRYD
jgi:uroporphyrinogen decarboxylase